MTENQFHDKDLKPGLRMLVSEQGTVKLGRLFLEAERGDGGIAIFERDPRRDLDYDDPEHERAWKDLQYVGIDAVDCLILLDYLKAYEQEFVSQIARRAKEARR